MLSPSLLSADFACLRDSIRSAEVGGAEWLHLDVMDGHFVPNLTIGPDVVAAVRRTTSLTLDCHLMIEQPDAMIHRFAEAGANVITVHAEACPHLHRTVQHIHEEGVMAGVAVNPATPLVMIEEILSEINLVLLMSVNPGFGGQRFIPSLYERAGRLREMIARTGRKVLVEADGGIKLDNAREVFASGVDVLVSGSGVFGMSDPAGALREMRRVCDGAV